MSPARSRSSSARDARRRSSVFEFAVASRSSARAAERSRLGLTDQAWSNSRSSEPRRITADCAPLRPVQRIRLLSSHITPRTLDVVTRTRSSQLGPDARPVAIPDDVADPAIEKAHGAVELPLNVRRSGSPRIYDLADRADLMRVYEQVLREGTEDDVRRYVDVDELLELWDELVLPPYVRRAWAGWYWRHRGISVAC